MSSPLIILTAQRPRAYRKHPAFGILYLARALLDAGFRVKVIHAVDDRPALILKAVAEERPLFVGMSVIATPLFAEDLAISRALHERGVMVVWGGIYPSMMPETALAADYVDIILRGEAERTVVELARRLAAGEGTAGIPGAGYRDRGEIRLVPEAPFHDDLDPFEPAWEFCSPRDYATLYPQSGDIQMMLPIARGCPFRCAFCYNQSNPERRRFRMHSVEWVRRQLAIMRDKYKITLVNYVCDNPFGKVEKGKAVIAGADMPWTSTSRIDIVDRDFAAWLKQSQCRGLFFGFESGVDRVLKVLRKGFTTAAMESGVAALEEAGIFCSANWMHLIPTETEDERRETRKFMDRLYRGSKHLWYDIQGLRPYPGTPIWDECLKIGLQAPTTNEEWTRVHTLIAPLFGWTEDRLRRLVLLNRLLYGRAGAAKRPVPDAEYDSLRERFIEGAFAGPVEEELAKRPGLERIMADA